MTDRVLARHQVLFRIGLVFFVATVTAGVVLLPVPPDAAQAADKDDPTKEEPLTPGSFAGRGDKVRDKLWADEGGNDVAQAALAAGLKWIIRHQAADGRWSLDQFHVHGKCNCSGPGAKYDVAATAFGLLSLLGAGETHKGTSKNHPYAKHVDRALKWLLTKQSANGALDGNGYPHALATMALCEAYGMTQDPALKEPAQKAIDCCVAWQHPAGGFRYTPGSPGDLSVSSWFIQAIKTGQTAGLNVPEATLKGINTFLDSVANADGSGYGYMQPQAAPATTAAGLLSRELMGWKAKNPGLSKGIDLLQKLPPSPNYKNIYFYYYATQVVHHVGGDAWTVWNPKMRDLLIAKQDQGQDPDRRDQKGSWSPEEDAWGGQLGRLGYSALALLTLEVYVRHVPLYPRGKDGK